jgi:hypothetical protein
MAALQQAPRERLGLSAPLMGTGWAARSSSAKGARGARFGDRRSRARRRLALLGVRVAYEPAARVCDESRARSSAAPAQRWMRVAGRWWRTMCRAWFWPRSGSTAIGVPPSACGRSTPAFSSRRRRCCSRAPRSPPWAERSACSWRSSAHARCCWRL